MRSFSQTLIIHRRLERRNQRQRARAGRRRSTLITLGLVIFIGFALLIIAAAGLYASTVAGLPNPAALFAMLDPASGTLMVPTRLYDRTGQHLIASLENPGSPRRSLVIDPSSPDAMDPLLVHTFVALHDPNFWNEPGVNWDRITSLQPVTLAEKLVNDLLLWQESPGWRKTFRMRMLAMQVVQQYGHTQVLEWYLNSASFGHLAYGVDSAARLYLGKSATSLTLPEAALLSAVATAPALNPLDSPAAARDLQSSALRRLREDGLISQADYQSAASAELKFAPELAPANPPAQAFANLVVQRLSERFNREWIERGGLRIQTTLDLNLQQQLSCTLQTQLGRLAGKSTAVPEDCEAARLLPAGTTPVSSAVSASAVLMDAQTGEVLALVGDMQQNTEQPVLSRQQPGSILTPFIAVAGFARGMGPASLLWDVPPVEETALISFKNPDGKYHGPVRLRTALANDYLVPFEGLLQEIGDQSVWQTAASLGLTHLSTAESGSILFEGGAVSPLEMAQAYSTLATLGVRNGERDDRTGQIEPVLVLSMKDRDGRSWLEHDIPDSQAVLSQPLAYLVNHILSDEAARWPSLGYPNALEIGRPAGARIGTTSSGLSTWTAGYTPQVTAVVWMGLPADSTDRLDPSLSADVWHAVLQYATRDLPVERWNAPAGITTRDVCDPSGLLPTQLCPAIVSEVFATGNEPQAYDDLYRSFPVNRETSRLATVFTPPELVENRSFLVVPPQAQAWALQANLPIPPTDYDVIQPPSPDPNVQISRPALFSYVHGKVEIRGVADGNDFASYRLQVGEGLNPQNWFQVGEEGTKPVKNGLLGVWDSAGKDGLYAIRLVVVHDDHTVQNALTQVTIDNTPPLVHVPYPSEGAQFELSKSKTITFQASVAEQLGVREVTWWLDGKRIGSSLQSPFAFIWTATAGDHRLQVKATDLAGNEGASIEIHFTVKR